MFNCTTLCLYIIVIDCNCSIISTLSYWPTPCRLLVAMLSQYGTSTSSSRLTLTTHLPRKSWVRPSSSGRSSCVRYRPAPSPRTSDQSEGIPNQRRVSIKLSSIPYSVSIYACTPTVPSSSHSAFAHADDSLP